MDDAHFMEKAKAIASLSLDRSTKTGCVIVGDDGGVLVSGFNSLPAGAAPLDQRFERPEKYFWTEHAERNAIYAAAESGIALGGSTAYVNWYPCMDCARALVQVGVKAVVCTPVNMNHDKYAAEFERAKTLFQECGVAVRFAETLQEESE